MTSAIDANALAKPGFQTGEKRRALFLTDTQTPAGTQAVDRALDIEQRIDAFHRLQRDRGDGRGLFAAPCVGSDIGQLEELAPGVCPAQRRRDGASSRAGS
jgi:hypothetical protein